MEDNKTYKLFDNDEEKFNLVSPTNQNIKEVLTIPAFSTHKSNDERVYYAIEGEVVPIQRNEKGQMVLNDIEDKYDADTYWAYLCQAMFIEDLGLFDEDGEIITERKAWLNRQVAKEAFDDFLGKWAMIPFEVENLLKSLTMNRSVPAIAGLVVQEMVAQMEQIGSATKRN